MSAVVFIDRLKSADSKSDALIGLQRELEPDPLMRIGHLIRTFSQVSDEFGTSTLPRVANG